MSDTGTSERSLRANDSPHGARTWRLCARWALGFAWRSAAHVPDVSCPDWSGYWVTGLRDDGSLEVTSADGPRAGDPLALPPSYVTADLVLGYAGTVHSTQGRTVDT